VLAYEVSSNVDMPNLVLRVKPRTKLNVSLILGYF